MSFFTTNYEIQIKNSNHNLLKLEYLPGNANGYCTTKMNNFLCGHAHLTGRKFADIVVSSVAKH